MMLGRAVDLDQRWAGEFASCDGSLREAPMLTRSQILQVDRHLLRERQIARIEARDLINRHACVLG